MQFNDEIFYQDDRGRWFSFELVHVPKHHEWRAFYNGFLANAPTREEVIEKAKATIAIQRKVF